MCDVDCTHVTTTLAADVAVYADEVLEWSELALPAYVETMCAPDCQMCRWCQPEAEDVEADDQ